MHRSLRLGNQRHSAARQTLLRLYTVSPSASDDQYDLEKSFAEKNDFRDLLKGMSRNSSSIPN